MKKCSKVTAVFFMFCMIAVSFICFPDNASAKEITSVRQAVKLAKKEVKGAAIIEVDTDRKNGWRVYEIEMRKGKREYNLVYRASDSKLISYEYEVRSIYIKRSSGKVIGADKCKKLAKKQVPKGKIVSMVKKYSDGISVYKVKMKKGNKKYEMKFRADDGSLLEYEWEFITKNKKSKPVRKDDYDDYDDDHDDDDDDEYEIYAAIGKI